MTDHLIQLPSNFRYMYQFNGGSQYKCVEACLSMAGEIAFPDRYADPAKLMVQIYEQYVGPDVPGDRNGTTKEQAIEWLTSQHIGFIDMQHFIDAGAIDELHAELMAQNQQNIPQIISIGDESYLKSAKTGLTLHNWADSLNHGSHTMLRVGYSDTEGQPWGYYYEPAAAPNFSEPVPIALQDFLDGKIVGCIAIMPHGVPVPPPGFLFSQGSWPPVKPTFDVAKAENTIAAISQALDAMKAAMANLANDLGALKQEV